MNQCFLSIKGAFFYASGMDVNENACHKNMAGIFI